MKQHIYYLILLISVSSLVVSCDSKEILYSDDAYTMFSDSILDMPVTVDENRIFDVDIASTKAVDYDRNYIVEVVYNKSNAIEGYHYDILNSNVTIKAGERSAKLQMKGYYNHIEENDSLAVTFRLISLRNDKWDLYPDEVNVGLIKCYPFNIDDYAGDVRMRCTFPFSESATTFLLKTEKKDANTLIVKAPFSDNYDMVLKIKPDPENPFNRDITVAEQPVFIVPTYGQVFVQSMAAVPSYYIVPEKALVLYLNVFLPKVGSFGAYYYILQWITPEEAEAEKNETGSPYFLRSASLSGYSLNKNLK